MESHVAFFLIYLYIYLLNASNWADSKSIDLNWICQLVPNISQKIQETELENICVCNPCLLFIFSVVSDSDATVSERIKEE